MKRLSTKIKFYANISVSNLLVYAIVFTLPLNVRANGLFIILFTLVSLYEYFNGKKDFNFRQNRKWILVFSSLFLVQLIGLFYSDEKESALAVLERSLTLIIFPLAIIPDKKKSNLRFLTRIILVLIVSCLVVIISSWSYVIIDNFQSGRRFSYIFHWAYSHNQLIQFFDVSGNYFVMYLIFSMSTIIYLIDRKILSGALIYYLLFIVVIFFGFILHLNSKIGVIIILIFSFFYFVNKAVIQKSIRPIFGVILVFSLIIIAINNMSYFKKRVFEYAVNIEKGEVRIKEGRLNQWKAIINNFDGNVILGYGTGATKKHVLRFYEKEGLSKAIKYKYNAHNQFIQFFIANGLLGVFCFLLCIVLPLKLALSSKDWIFVSFIFVFFFTSLVESTLLRQKGIVFFALFNSLLIANFSKRTFFSNKSQSKVLNI